MASFAALESAVRNLRVLVRQLQSLEAVRLVGSADEPAFGSGWANLGGGVLPAGFYQHQGRVWLQGTVTKTTGLPVVGDVIFTLPAGYRPAGQALFEHDDGTAFTSGRVDVLASGAVQIGAHPATSEADYVSLDGISFRV